MEGGNSKEREQEKNAMRNGVRGKQEGGNKLKERKRDRTRTRREILSKEREKKEKVGRGREGWRSLNKLKGRRKNERKKEKGEKEMKEGEKERQEKLG